LAFLDLWITAPPFYAAGYVKPLSGSYTYSLLAATYGIPPPHSACRLLLQRHFCGSRHADPFRCHLCAHFRLLRQRGHLLQEQIGFSSSSLLRGSFNRSVCRTHGFTLNRRKCAYRCCLSVLPVRAYALPPLFSYLPARLLKPHRLLSYHFIAASSSRGFSPLCLNMVAWYNTAHVARFCRSNSARLLNRRRRSLGDAFRARPLNRHRSAFSRHACFPARCARAARLRRMVSCRC